jgi:AcrR family transcriptional regulator
VPTIYYTFGTKAQLLDEALGAAIMGFDVWRPAPPDIDAQPLLPWHGWWADFDAAATSADALAILLHNAVEILRRVAPLVSALHGAVGDAEADEVMRVAEERRVRSYREAVQAVAAKPGGLRAGLTVRTACDVLVVLFSAELYHAVRQGRRWSEARTAAFLEELVTAQLLDD